MGIHIGVDAWNLPNDRRGIGRYVRSLLHHWQALGPERVQITLIVPEKLPAFVRRRYLDAAGVADAAVRSRSSAERAGLDCLWYPWNGLSWSARGVKVATLHDASLFALAPADPQVREREQRTFRTAARESDRIITDSHFSKHEIERYLAIPSERIEVVHLGVEPAFASLAPAPDGQAVADRYLLFVGEWEPRKGLGTLCAAAASLPDELRSGLELLVVGQRTGGVSIGAFPNVRVRALGHVADDRLAALYARAAAFVYPSRYEGFGLPVLEAMACGAPVIASNAAGIPEAGGDAALYVAPDDVGALADAVKRVLLEPGLAARLREAGLKRAATMTWKKTADATLAVMERAVRAGARR